MKNSTLIGLAVAILLIIAGLLVYHEYNERKSKDVVVTQTDDSTTTEMAPDYAIDAFLSTTDPVVLSAEELMFYRQEHLKQRVLDSLLVIIPEDKFNMMAKVLIAKNGKARLTDIIPEYYYNYNDIYSHIETSPVTRDTIPKDTAKSQKTDTINKLIPVQ